MLRTTLSVYVHPKKNRDGFGQLSLEIHTPPPPGSLLCKKPQRVNQPLSESVGPQDLGGGGVAGRLPAASTAGGEEKQTPEPGRKTVTAWHFLFLVGFFFYLII